MTVTRLLRPVLLTALLAAAAWIVARAPLPAVHASVAAQPLLQSPVVGAGPYRAGLVVRFGDGHVESRCVKFQEQEITGDELLTRSGLTGIIIAAEGTVCSIGGQGCPSDNCFCQCPFPDCLYWAYYHRTTAAWEYSQIGATSSIIHDGDLDGWSWGQGDFESGVEPPQVTFEQVCPAETSATATPTSTATTQSAGSTAPQVSFYALASVVTPGQCTMLNWLTSGATSVTLDGAPVALQGSQQVCPTASQTWTLLASNTVGLTNRQVAVQVQATDSGAATSTPTATATHAAGNSTPTSRATVSISRQVLPTPLRPVVTLAAQPLPGQGQPTPGLGVSPAATTDLSGGGVPLAPTAEQLPVLTPTPPPTPTRYEFALPPTETPRPRRVLDGDGPTPTPILIARASGGSNQASAAAGVNSSASVTGGNDVAVQSRSFSPGLLPGYAAYLASLGALLVMGWYVHRRRSEHIPAAVRGERADGRPNSIAAGQEE